MKFPEINTLEDMKETIEVTQWNLIELVEESKRRGFYQGIWVGIGLIGFFTLLRNVF